MGKTLRLAGTIGESIVDGPGLRYVIFTQGCPHHCPGCHNPETHPFEGGTCVDSETLVHEILRDPLLSGVTFSGGEPFAQAEGLCAVADALAGRKHLMAYTGYTLEQLQQMEDPWVGRLLDQLDVLVDGPFVQELRNIDLRFRGSENQRVLDMRASRAAGEAVWDARYR